jgi:hypothetical protein
VPKASGAGCSCIAFMDSTGTGTDKSALLLLALVQEAPVWVGGQFIWTPVHYCEKLGGHEIVDVSTVMCTIGRVHDQGLWYITDHSGVLAMCTNNCLVSDAFESWLIYISRRHNITQLSLVVYLFQYFSIVYNPNNVFFVLQSTFYVFLHEWRSPRQHTWDAPWQDAWVRFTSPQPRQQRQWDPVTRLASARASQW